jgi:hypothetical protein
MIRLLAGPHHAEKLIATPSMRLLSSLSYLLLESHDGESFFAKKKISIARERAILGFFHGNKNHHIYNFH